MLVQHYFQPFLSLSEVTLLNETQGRNMVNFFILPFLRRNTTGEVEVHRCFIWRFWSSWRWFHCVCCVCQMRAVCRLLTTVLSGCRRTLARSLSLCLSQICSPSTDSLIPYVSTSSHVISSKKVYTNNTDITSPVTDILLFFCVSLVGDPGQSHSKAGGWTDGWRSTWPTREGSRHQFSVRLSACVSCGARTSWCSSKPALNLTDGKIYTVVLDGSLQTLVWCLRVSSLHVVCLKWYLK